MQETFLVGVARLAARHGKVLVIHSRDHESDVIGTAAQQVLAILENMSLGSLRVYVHCFCGNGDELIRWQQSLPEVYFGVSRRTLEVEAARLAVAKVDITRILVETDAPYLEEHPWKIGRIIEKLARFRNIPAALYKAMGGFATNGVNMTKLESYMLGGSFTATQFYADIEGHPDDPEVRRALEELDYFTSYIQILGAYPADPRRH